MKIRFTIYATVMVVLLGLNVGLYVYQAMMPSQLGPTTNDELAVMRASMGGF